MLASISHCVGTHQHCCRCCIVYTIDGVDKLETDRIDLSCERYDHHVDHFSSCIKETPPKTKNKNARIPEEATCSPSIYRSDFLICHLILAAQFPLAESTGDAKADRSQSINGINPELHHLGAAVLTMWSLCMHMFRHSKWQTRRQVHRRKLCAANSEGLRLQDGNAR